MIVIVLAYLAHLQFLTSPVASILPDWMVVT